MSGDKKYDWSITVDPNSGEDLTMVCADGFTRGEHRRLNIITHMRYQHTEDDWDFVCEMIAKQGRINDELRHRNTKLEAKLELAEAKEAAQSGERSKR